MAKRYQSQQILPEIGNAGQAKLDAAKVLVVGCGGLAASVLPYLVAAGVGEITLIDDDSIELSNLNRQILFSEYDIGQNKAEVTSQQLLKQNPQVIINVVKEKFNLTNGIALVRKHHIVLDCSDTYLAKISINYCCSQTRTAWVYASVLGWDGQAALLSMNNSDAPCYKCWQAHAPHNVAKCGSSGVLGAAVNAVGSHQATLALQYLLGYTHNENYLWVFDLWSLEQKKFQLNKRAKCKFHCNKPNNLAYCSYADLVKGEEYVLLDIRSNEEWEAGHLPQAQHISPGLLMKAEQLYPRTQKLVVYCNQNTLSSLVVENLRDMGYSAFVLSGGYQANAHLAIHSTDLSEGS